MVKYTYMIMNLDTDTNGLDGLVVTHMAAGAKGLGLNYPVAQEH